MEVTVEISDDKTPRYSDLPQFFQNNLESMLSYLEQPLKLGVQGLVRDAETQEPVHAKIHVAGRDGPPVYSRLSNGAFSKMLLPGNYTVCT